MPTRMTTKGQCQNCQTFVSKQSATKHCQKCFVPLNQAVGNPCFLIKVSSFSPLYWLYIAAPAQCTLQSLDGFLRHIWLECCGHLSSYAIDGVQYDSYPQEDYPDMNIKLDAVFSKGKKAEYEYDFGSTTHLTLEVIDVYKSTLRTKPRLLMRNSDPEFFCYKCQKPANQVCSACDVTVCNKHVEHGSKQECDDGGEYCLPLVNSPRAGTCGYAG